MRNILEDIVLRTKEEIKQRKKRFSLKSFHSFEAYQRPRRDFAQALNQKGKVSVIAEIKKASPSKGVIRKDFNPLEIAINYEENGAAALSVLTEEAFFQGRLSYLELVSSSVDIPVLRKDFIIDPYQIEEAKAFGADALLLIVKILDGNQLFELYDAAIECGMQVLVECYDEADRNRLDFNRISILGVNNRDLSTFKVDLHRGIALLKEIPAGIIRVSESGLNEPESLSYLLENGIHSALIGEHFMRSADPGAELARFLNRLL